MKRSMMHNQPRAAQTGRRRKADRTIIHQITIRGIDPLLAEAIRRIARAEDISLNQAALHLLLKGAGLLEHRRSRAAGNALDRWFGTWSDKQAEEFFKAIQSCEQLDPTMWR